MPNLREIGKKGEKSAELFLKKRGYKIIERNFRTPFGELDLIVKDNDILVFVEVKTRNSEKFGLPEDAITYKKRLHIIRSAFFYLKRYNLIDSVYRFDVVAVMPSEIRHYKDAFSGEEFLSF